MTGIYFVLTFQYHRGFSEPRYHYGVCRHMWFHMWKCCIGWIPDLGSRLCLKLAPSHASATIPHTLSITHWPKAHAWSKSVLATHHVTSKTLTSKAMTPKALTSKALTLTSKSMTSKALSSTSKSRTTKALSLTSKSSLCGRSHPSASSEVAIKRIVSGAATYRLGGAILWGFAFCCFYNDTIKYKH